MTTEHRTEAAGGYDPVFEMVRDCVAEVLDIPPESVTPGTRLRDDLGADSLDLAEIITRIEGRSGVVIEPSRLILIATVGDACAVLAADPVVAADPARAGK